MAEHYPDLGPGDRREVLEYAASESGRPAYLLQKDISGGLGSPDIVRRANGRAARLQGRHVPFQGIRAIRRISENVDLTYDNRALVPDLVDDSPHPPAGKPVIGTALTAVGFGAELPICDSERDRCRSASPKRRAVRPEIPDLDTLGYVRMLSVHRFDGDFHDDERCRRPHRPNRVAGNQGGKAPLGRCGRP